MINKLFITRRNETIVLCTLTHHCVIKEGEDNPRIGLTFFTHWSLFLTQLPIGNLKKKLWKNNFRFLHLLSFEQDFSFQSFHFVAAKTYCQACKKKCSGEVLRVKDKYFHISCFKCSQCKTSLAQGGFFEHGGSYYCTKVSTNQESIFCNDHLNRLSSNW